MESRVTPQDADAANAAAPRSPLRGSLPSLGARIDNYLLRAVVGQGSTSTVYVAERGGAQVALKVMLPELLSEDAAHQVFDDEAMIGRAVSHPNVALALRRGTWQDLPYLVLELVHGRSYADVLRRAQQRNIPLPAGFHLWLLAEASEGLHAAHEAVGPGGAAMHVVHRDVKPQNVLIGFDGRCKVVDFGVAAARGRSFRTATGACKGTLAYLAPEQITSPRAIDRRADVWALGVLAWEALAGRRLFKRATPADTVQAIVRADVPALSEVMPRVHAAVHDVVMRCLRRDPAARPATASAVAEAFRRAAKRLGFTGTRGVVEIMKVLFDDDERRADRPAPRVAPDLPTPLTSLAAMSATAAPTPAALCGVDSDMRSAIAGPAAVANTPVFGTPAAAAAERADEEPTTLWIGIDVVECGEATLELPVRPAPRRPPPRRRPPPASSRAAAQHDPVLAPARAAVQPEPSQPRITPALQSDSEPPSRSEMPPPPRGSHPSLADMTIPPMPPPFTAWPTPAELAQAVKEDVSRESFCAVVGELPVNSVRTPSEAPLEIDIAFQRELRKGSAVRWGLALAAVLGLGCLVALTSFDGDSAAEPLLQLSAGMGQSGSRVTKRVSMLSMVSAAPRPSGAGAMDFEP